MPNDLGDYLLDGGDNKNEIQPAVSQPETRTSQEISNTSSHVELTQQENNQCS